MFVIDVFDLTTGGIIVHNVMRDFVEALYFYDRVRRHAESADDPEAAILYMSDTGEIIYGFNERIIIN